ncbi:DUF6236 family protein [Vibrio cyclitrophicus]|uniref:DUF6236 family protein n=1 Tax=Vibrio cyclitrophicus TaxID=47951 RepID=UPI00029ADA1F|nr:DUF6236 family protein [Vibrio cyclitrophicus]OEE29142.1 hypothetical protein OAM_07715 [Vibrio cyclitrophicus ZF14]
MERGIVAPAQKFVITGSSTSITDALTPETLRYFALYWDKIAVTGSMVYGFRLSEESKKLEQANILRKEVTPLAEINSSGGFNQMHFDSLSKVTTKLTTKNPGQWTIHQSGKQLIIPASMSEELVTAEFELTKCLPFPKAEYPLEELLEFKLKRSDELAGLRQTLDELYLEISKSQDIPRSKIAQVTRLERAISELDLVAKQSWGDRLFASRNVSLDLNYGSVGQGLTVGSVVGASYNSPILGVIAGAGQALLSSMKFEVNVSSQLSSSIGNQIELSYLSSLKKENIV